MASCPSCGRYFRSGEELAEHVGEQHGDGEGQGEWEVGDGGDGDAAEGVVDDAPEGDDSSYETDGDDDWNDEVDDVTEESE